MTLYQIAFKDWIAIGVIGQFTACEGVGMKSMFMSEYGLTVFVEISDENILTEFDWAFCMLCNMEQ